MIFDVLAAIGLVVVSIGVAMIYVPAALIVLGLGLIGYAMAAGYNALNRAANKGGQQ